MYFHAKLIPIFWISVLYLAFHNVESSNNTSNVEKFKINRNQTSVGNSGNDCTAYTSCTTCVSSSSPCDWCMNGHRCTHDTSENCRNDILVTGVSRGGPSYRSGPIFCPRVDTTQDGSSEILIPSGTKKGIRVKIQVIGYFMVQTRFLCQFNIEGRIINVNSDLIGDIIYCNGMEFEYAQNAPNMTATFDVIWDGSKPLDNPNGIHVVIYKCRNMATSNDECLAIEKTYGCGWCLSTNTCEYNTQCNITAQSTTTASPNITSNYTNVEIIVDQLSNNTSNFKCSDYRSCIACVSSSFPCDWCIGGHRCTHDTSENCRNDILVTGVSREGPSYRSGPNFCPRINTTQDGSSEILVPSGTKKSIRVKVQVIGYIITQTRFLCQSNIEGQIINVNSNLIGDTVYCDGMEFGYAQNAPNTTATFGVIWDSSKSLDNPNGIHVVIYKCRNMATSNDECLAVDTKYGCGWCQSTNSCEYNNQCSGL